MNAVLGALLLVALHPARAGESMIVCRWAIVAEQLGPLLLLDRRLVCERIFRFYEVRA